MAYITLSQLYGELPEAVITDALDDNRDGAVDSGVVDLVLDGASQAVDAFLLSRYSVPLATPNALVKRAAKVFALEMCYSRREIKNFPLAGEAKLLRERLQLIAIGQLNLDASAVPVNSPGSALTEPLLGSGGNSAF